MKVDQNSQTQAPTLSQLEEQSKQGDAEAQLKLGIMYAKGRGVEQDIKKALEYFRKAAKQDHAEAQFCLARLCAHEGDHTQAALWFQSSADLGFVPAQEALLKLNKKTNIT